MKRCLWLVGLVAILWGVIFVQWQLYYDESIMSTIQIEKIEIVHDKLNQRIDCSTNDDMIDLVKEVKLISYDGQRKNDDNPWYLCINDGEVLIKAQDHISYSKINYRIKNLEVYQTLLDHMNQTVVKK